MLLGEHRVAYELKRARRRSIGFVVGAEGLRVSAPRWLPQADIERALQQKSDWILRKLVEQRERARRVQAARIEWRDGASLAYLGEPLRLKLDPLLSGVQFDATSRVLSVGLPLAASEEQIRDAVQSWLQRSARAMFEPRCAHFAAAIGVQMKQLRLQLGADPLGQRQRRWLDPPELAADPFRAGHHRLRGRPRARASARNEPQPALLGGGALGRARLRTGPRPTARRVNRRAVRHLCEWRIPLKGGLLGRSPASKLCLHAVTTSIRSQAGSAGAASPGTSDPGSASRAGMP